MIFISKLSNIRYQIGKKKVLVVIDELSANPPETQCGTIFDGELTFRDHSQCLLDS